MAKQTTQLFLEKSWREFRSPYYDPVEKLVYCTVITKKSKLLPTDTWKQIGHDHQNDALAICADTKMFTVEVDLDLTTEPVSLPLTKNDGSCILPKTSDEENTLQTQKNTVNKDMFELAKYDIGPRPDDLVKLLYSFSAFKTDGTPLVDIKRIDEVFAAEEAQKNKPNYSMQVYNKVQKRLAPSGADFKIDSIEDFGKILDIKSLGDINSFLASTVESTAQLRTKYIAGPLNAQPGDLKTNLESLWVEGISGVAATANLPSKVYNNTLQSTEFIADYFIFKGLPAYNDVQQAIGNFKDPLKNPAITEAERAAEAAKYKKWTSGIQVYIKFINQYGLIGLFECLIALSIEKASAQGYVAVAALLTRELDRFVKNVLTISVEYAQYRRLYEKLKVVRKRKKVDWYKIFKEAGTTALETSVKELLKLATKSCLKHLASDDPENDFNFGGLAPAQLYADRTLPLKGLAELFNSPPDEEESKQILDFVDAVFKNLTPQELCRLLEGMAEYELVQFCESLLAKEQFAEAAKFLDTPQKIADFFRNIGLRAGTSICNELNEEANEAIQQVDYCEIKVPKAYKEAMQLKCGDNDQGDVNCKALFDQNKKADEEVLAALGDIFSDDFFENQVPSIDYFQLLQPAYDSSQDLLRNYQKMFDKDYKDGLTAGGTTNITELNTYNKTDKDKLGLGDDALDDGSVKTGDIFGKLKNIDKPTPINFAQPVFDEATLPYNDDSTDQGAFTILNESDMVLKITTDGKYKITNAAPIFASIPTEGTVSYNQNSPLVNVGKSLKDLYTETADQFSAKRILWQQGTEKIQTEDLYKDIAFSLVKERLSQISGEVQKIAENKLEFFKKERLKRINDMLCDAGQSETTAEPFVVDNKIAIKIEALRILIYAFLIEKYPYLYFSSLLNPEGLIDPKDVKVTFVPKVATEFTEYINSRYAAPVVKQLMCATGLSVEDLVKEELEFINKLSPSKETKLFSTILKDKFSINPKTNVPFSYVKPPAFKNWIKSYTYKGATGTAAYLKAFKYVSDLGQAGAFNWMGTRATDSQPQLDDYNNLKNRVISFFEITKKGFKIYPEPANPKFKFDGLDEFRDVYPRILSFFFMMLDVSGQLEPKTPDKNYKVKIQNLVEDCLLKPSSFRFDGGTIDLEYQGVIPQFTYNRKILVNRLKLNDIPLGQPLFNLSYEVQRWVNTSYKAQDNKKQSYITFTDELVKQFSGTIIEEIPGTEHKFKKINIDLFNEPPTAKLFANETWNEFYKAVEDPTIMVVLTKYYLNKYAFSLSADHDIFKTLKPAIISSFLGGTETYGKSAKELSLAFAQFQNAAITAKSTEPMWLLILMMMPKIIYQTIKAIIMAALYVSQPMIYILLMMADALGYGPEEFLEWLDEQSKEKMLEELAPGSPEYIKVSQEKEDKQTYLELKCEV